MVRHPAMPVAGATILGIFAHEALPLWPGLWLSLFGLLIAGAIATFRRGVVCTVMILLAIGISAMLAAQLAAFRYPPDHISAFATDPPRLVQLEMRLDYPPRDLTAPYSRGMAVAPKQVATASVVQIKSWNGWIPCDGKILVQINQPNPRLRQGQVLRILGRLERPGPAANPGQFDWAGYYREQNILASVRIDSAEGITILNESPSGPLTWLRAQARRALAAGFEQNDSLDHALLRALLLGDNDPELRDVQEQFRRTGTSHHLAISGMHVAILGTVVFLMCRLLRIGPRAACWVGLIAVALYGAVALPSPPVVRSILLSLSVGIGILGRRSYDMLQLLAISVIAMLVYHPLDLYNAGFQLSFGMVLGLMLFTPPVLDWLPGNDPDVKIAMSHQGPRVFGSPMQKLKSMIRQIVAASLVAWVVAMPLIALHFEQLNPWAIPASLILSPFVLVSLVMGFAKVLMTIGWPSLSGAWAEMARTPVEWMRWMVDWLATLPGSEVPVPAPAIWMVVLFYGLLLSLLISWPRRWMKPVLRLAAVGCFVTMVTVSLRDGLSLLQLHADELKVTLLSVGAGQCAVVEPPGAPAVVIDAGSATLSDVSYKALGPFLRHQGRREVGAIYISHANLDHFSAVADVVAAYDVPTIYASSQFQRHSIDNPPAKALLLTLDEFDRPPRIVLPGQTFDLGGGAMLQCLWPEPDLDMDANNCSMVLRLTFAGKSILFTGDIQLAAERELLKSPESLKADVLVAPHHGSRENSTAEFVEAVSPQVIVSSNDRTLSMKQRDFDREMAGKRVYRTHTSGAVTVRIAPNGRIYTDTFLPTTSPR